METRQLGKDGPQVTVLGLGTWPLGGGMGQVDEQTAIRTVRTAIDHGIQLIDTAQGYLAAETLLGKALRDGYRERCFLATKVSGDFSREGTRLALENSLKMLDVDFVDLYQIHWWDSSYPMEESIEEMARLQEQGKTRFTGVSNFNAGQMEQALRVARFQSSQPGYNMLDREIEAVDIPFCELEGIGILAHSPLAKGLLTGKYSPDDQFAPDDERSGFSRFQGETFRRYLALADELKTIAQEKGLTLAQLAVAWILRLPAISCVLVGAKNPAQVLEHLGASGVSFSDDELYRIEAILEKKPE